MLIVFVRQGIPCLLCFKYGLIKDLGLFNFLCPKLIGSVMLLVMWRLQVFFFMILLFKPQINYLDIYTMEKQLKGL